jgi:hypothetical protein
VAQAFKINQFDGLLLSRVAGDSSERLGKCKTEISTDRFFASSGQYRIKVESDDIIQPGPTLENASESRILFVKPALPLDWLPAANLAAHSIT